MVDAALPYLACPPERHGSYGAWSADLRVWRPYVEEAAGRHGLPVPRAITVPTRGCHAVFLADAACLWKFYAPHWRGDFGAERDVLAALCGAAGVPAPRVLAEGTLFPEAAGRWPWPYLALTAVPGRAVDALRPELSGFHLMTVARELGPVLRSLHRVPVPGGPSGDWVRRIPRLRRTAPERRRRDHWPGDLLRHLPEYFEDALGGGRQGTARVVHGDVHGGHVFLQRGRDGAWEVAGLIDFADAVAGDPAYELVALFVGLFRCAPAPLRAFLEAYGPHPAFGPGCRRRATAHLILFPNDWMPALRRYRPAAARARTLEEFEAALWAGALEA